MPHNIIFLDSSVLEEALNSGDISGAVVDVVESESSLASDLLFFAENLILTPHIAWSSVDS